MLHIIKFYGIHLSKAIFKISSVLKENSQKSIIIHSEINFILRKKNMGYTGHPKAPSQLNIPVVYFRTYFMCGVKKSLTRFIHHVRKPMRRCSKHNNICNQLVRVSVICHMKDTFLYILFRMQTFYEQHRN